METEEEFGISLATPQLEGALTVRDLAAVVSGAIQRNRQVVCPTSARFFRLRSAWSQSGLVPRKKVRPEAAVAELVPWSMRLRAWEQLREADVQPQPLRVHWALKAPLALLAVTGLAYIVFGPWSGYWSVWAGVLLIGSIGVAYFKARRFLPAGVITIEDLVRTGHGGEVVVEHDVIGRVRQIVARQMGLPIEKVLPESRFVDDLNID